MIFLVKLGVEIIFGLKVPKTFLTQFQTGLDNLLIMKKIAVYTSGGDAPGMNACIRGFWYREGI